MHSYAWRELVRNPRRTLAALTGVALGVGLFSAVLFYADGSGATLTARALAPLAVDMQRVLTTPLGSGLRVEERLGATGPIAAGDPVTITLRVVNAGAEPAHDVVLEDEAPRPLRYVAGSATLNGAPLADGVGSGPFSQGVAGLGRNIGTVPAGSTVTITYRARAARAVRASTVQPRARVSSRESLVPVGANRPRPWSLAQVRARLASIDGVASADALAFVDLPPGTLRARGVVPPGQVRVFAFDRRYRDRHPPMRIVSGSFRRDAALLSVEAARALGLRPGSTVELHLPAGRRITLPVSGVLDLSGARALFSSRRSRDLESFLYVPQAIVVSPATFSAEVVPALRSASARLGGVVKSLPVEEVDVLVQRRRLHTNPADALTQTRAVARSIGRVAPQQDYLIDNISNTLMVARADAAVGKRMFLFLGLPAVLLSALVAAYAGSVLAAAQRREHALLRLRGANRLYLTRALAYRAVALAAAGSVLGTAAGFLTARAILGPHALGQAAPGALALSALAALGGGLLVTALALYIPGRRALAREIAEERRELALSSPPMWRRAWLDVVLLGAAAVAALIALRTGALDGTSGSVFEGRSVSLPSYLLLIPLLAWVGGVLVVVRVLLALALRLPMPAWSRGGGATAGLLARGLRRRPWEIAAGAVALGLVIAFGTSLRAFIATYDTSKRADARFVVGSDLRISPGARPRTAAYASRLRVRGVSALTPVVFRAENSLLIGRYQRARTDLAAVDPATFGSATGLSGSAFRGLAPRVALARLRADPHAMLVEAATADDLSLEVGDRVRAVLALGTDREAEASFRIAGVFRRLTGFAHPPDVVVGLGAYRAATGATAVDFFLARTRDHSRAGVDRVARALRSGPGTRAPLAIQTTGTAIDKDQSSLTALDVRSLVDVGSLFTLLMSAAVLGIFLFGLLLGRRREYVVLSAQGMDARSVRVLVLGEAALVAAGGLAAGVIAGAASAVLLVQVLRPLFILPPDVVVPVDALAGLAAITAAALVAAGGALVALERVRPTEILRER
jgi:putative ABC transport system permease protein